MAAFEHIYLGPELASLAVFVISYGLVLFHHIGHPLILKLLDMIVADAEKPDFSAANGSNPTISILIPAYNEERYIRQKLQCLSGLIYPTDRLDITIVCDGCTDNTAQIVRDVLEDDGTLFGFPVTLIDDPTNLGKLERLNSIIPTLRGELVALTDVSAILSLDCMVRIGRWFENPSIGCVMGKYHILQPGQGQDAYWAYQTAVKRLEDKFGGVMGAHGAFYVIRKVLFKALPRDTINDDFIIPMNILAAGYQVRYDADIVALEDEVMPDLDELGRRKRIASGNIQQALRLYRLIHPKYGWSAYNFLAGKVLRTVCPLLLATGLGANMFLAAANMMFLVLLLFQLLLYVSVLLDLWHNYDKPLWIRRFWDPIVYLVVGHWIGGAALVRYLFKPRAGIGWR